MAYQKKQKKLNSRQKVTNTVTSNKGQTGFRKTYTTKTGPVTRSMSVNKNGSIRTTTTTRRQGGWIDRTTHTTPSAPKMRFPKQRKQKAPAYKKPAAWKRSKPRRRKKTAQTESSFGLNMWLFIMIVVILLI